MRYDFEWDPEKAEINRRKHKVRFNHAATVFRDPEAISIFDDEHNASEDRWITLGIASIGSLLVVYHTFDQVSENREKIRIFSSRKANKSEQKQYGV